MDEPCAQRGQEPVEADGVQATEGVWREDDPIVVAVEERAVRLSGGGQSRVG